MGPQTGLAANRTSRNAAEKDFMRLLIAEDDKALGLFLKRGLEADGHLVRLACDGAAAVEAFREEMPDLTACSMAICRLWC